MITGRLRNKIDKLWLEFWQGGITNPLTVIEQITFLMFIRLLDIEETKNEKRAQRTGKPFKGHFDGKGDPRRWNQLLKVGADECLVTVRDDVFPHIKEIAGSSSTFGKYMVDATFMIAKPSLLVKAMELIDELPLDRGDVKGDLYEYLLSKLTTAGINGQFRTPRHIIRVMVDMVEPQLDWVIGDPACGTAGFLCSVIDYFNEHNSSEDGTIEHPGENGMHASTTYLGDLLTPAQREFMRKGMFHGYDFDVSMLRIAAMNMMLHGVDNPHIQYMDTLSNRFPEQESEKATDCFDLILANPPFKGSLDYEHVHSSLLNKVKTKRTELLFVALMLRMLKLGGRCAVIVPDGVLFGTSRAHKGLRQMIVDDNQLEAVLSLPSGVFKPYAGVSTAILIFAKGGRTKDVFYFDVEADGFSLDDHRRPIQKNDLIGEGGVRQMWREWKAHEERSEFGDRARKAFVVPVAEIRENSYGLSISSYKERVYDEVQYDPPKKFIGRLQQIGVDVANELRELEAML